jgi:ferric-dicitrate binding protein FerR (iron transport regulator)
MNISKVIDIWSRLREGLVVSQEEELSLRAWLATPENRKAFHSHLLLEGELNELLKESRSSAVTPQSKEAESQHYSSAPMLKVMRFPWKAVSSLAGLLIFAFLLSHLANLIHPPLQQNVAQVASLTGFPKISRGQLEWPMTKSSPLRMGDRISTGEKEELELLLKDGTLIWVGPRSSLVIPKDFQLNHNLELEFGHLHLDVAKREQNLKVSLSTMAIEVLGTRFTLLHHPQVGKEMVHLQDGQVRASISNGDRRVLTPGQELLIENSGPAQLQQKAPYRNLKGIVESASSSAIVLIDESNNKHELRLAHPQHEPAHSTVDLGVPSPGQSISLKLIAGPNRIIHWETLPATSTHYK